MDGHERIYRHASASSTATAIRCSASAPIAQRSTAKTHHDNPPCSFTVDLPALIAARGADSPCIRMAPVACPYCGGRRVDFRISGEVVYRRDRASPYLNASGMSCLQRAIHGGRFVACAVSNGCEPYTLIPIK